MLRPQANLDWDIILIYSCKLTEPWNRGRFCSWIGGAGKKQILEDIFGKTQRYWQPQEKILAELEQIIMEQPKCLNAQEQEALVIRKKMFEDPFGNGIVVNLGGVENK